MKAKKQKKAKTISYELIGRQTDVGRPMYVRLDALVEAHHEDLQQEGARIALAWATSWKPDVDGRLTLGKCAKASDLSRELAPFDFIILLNKAFWLEQRVTNEQRQALLDHELCHAAVAYDEDGAAKQDDRGRAVFRIRKHDIEEFRDVVSRNGLYKSDLVEFASALAKAKAAVAGSWVGYTTLSEMLKAIGVTVDPRVIAAWSEHERSEVQLWARLRESSDSRAVGVVVSAETLKGMPPCLALVLGGGGEALTH